MTCSVPSTNFDWRKKWLKIHLWKFAARYAHAIPAAAQHLAVKLTI